MKGQGQVGHDGLGRLRIAVMNGFQSVRVSSILSAQLSSRHFSWGCGVSFRVCRPICTDTGRPGVGLCRGKIGARAR